MRRVIAREIAGVDVDAVHDATHPQADALQSAYRAISLDQVPVKSGEANLCAVLDTPRGRVKLHSKET